MCTSDRHCLTFSINLFLLILLDIHRWNWAWRWYRYLCCCLSWSWLIRLWWSSFNYRLSRIQVIAYLRLIRRYCHFDHLCRHDGCICNPNIHSSDWLCWFLTNFKWLQRFNNLFYQLLLSRFYCLYWAIDKRRAFTVRLHLYHDGICKSRMENIVHKLLGNIAVMIFIYM
jgi:hypothetical protein